MKDRYIVGPRWEYFTIAAVITPIILWCWPDFQALSILTQSRYIFLIAMDCYLICAGAKYYIFSDVGISRHWFGVRCQSIPWSGVDQIGMVCLRNGTEAIIITLVGGRRYNHKTPYSWYQIAHPLRGIVIDYKKNLSQEIKQYYPTLDYIIK